MGAGLGTNTVFFSANKDYGSASIDYFSVTMSLMILSFSVLSGQKTFTAGETPEEVEELYEGLTCQKVRTLGGFKLSADDASNYTDKLVFLEQRRDLKGPYPKGADSDLDTGFPVKSRSLVAASKPAAAGAPEPAATTSQELKDDLVQWHFNIVQMCKKVGIDDVCKSYKQTRMENIITGLSSKELKCKLCKKVFSSHQKLRNHIKIKHLKKTAHYCKECKKYYVDSGSLKLHLVSHDETASRFACKKCTMQFSTRGQLEKHQNSHQGKKYQCQYCSNKYAYPQGVKEHEASCKGNPSYKEGDTSDWYKCRICGKCLKHHRSLLRHLRQKHDNAPEFE